MSNQNDDHTIDKCPFGLTIKALKEDVTVIKESLVGDNKGNMGWLQKMNVLWEQYLQKNRLQYDVLNWVYKALVLTILAFLSARVGVPTNLFHGG